MQHVFFEAVVAVAVEAADAGKAVGEACARELFPNQHDFFTRVKSVHERSRTAQVLESCSHANKVVVNTGEFVHDHAEHLGAFRDFDAVHVFHSAAERDVVHHGRAVVQTVGVRDHLLPGAAFDHLFKTTVHKADFMDTGHDGFTIEGSQQAHAVVSCRVRRAHVQGHQVYFFAIRVKYDHSLILPSRYSSSTGMISLERWIILYPLSSRRFSSSGIRKSVVESH